MKILVFILLQLAINQSCFSQSINALMLRAKDLNCRIVIGTVAAIGESPFVTTSVPSQTIHFRNRGFFKMKINLESIVYNYKFDTKFVEQLPNLPRRKESFLISSSSSDPLIWIGPKIGQTYIFFIGQSSFDVISEDYCYGVLDVEQIEVLKKEIFIAITDQARYNLEILKWHARN